MTSEDIGKIRHETKVGNRFREQHHMARKSTIEFSTIKCMGSNADKSVKKSCGKEVQLYNAYKCLYCGFWFCETCMEKHLGKTKKQYQKERVERLDNERI